MELEFSITGLFREVNISYPHYNVHDAMQKTEVQHCHLMQGYRKQVRV